MRGGNCHCFVIVMYFYAGGCYQGGNPFVGRESLLFSSSCLRPRGSRYLGPEITLVDLSEVLVLSRPPHSTSQSCADDWLVSH